MNHSPGFIPDHSYLMLHIPSKEITITPYFDDDKNLQTFIDSAVVVSIPWSQLDKFEHITEPFVYSQFNSDIELLLTPELVTALRRDDILLWTNDEIKVVYMGVDDETYPIDWPDRMYKKYGIDVRVRKFFVAFILSIVLLAWVACLFTSDMPTKQAFTGLIVFYVIIDWKRLFLFFKE